MKRGTPDHPKTKRLAAVLGVSISHAVGLLECMWHFTARFAIQGNIGKHSDQAIAEAMYWTGRRTPLVGVLISVGWLDKDDTHRLLVHHWHEHADQSVKKTLQNKGLEFFRPAGWNDSDQSAEKVSPSLSLSLSHSRSLSSATETNADWKGACDCMSSELLKTDKFKATWRDWCKHRREIRKPLKETSIKMEIKRLEKLGLQRAIETIEYTIGQGWTGLREPDRKDVPTSSVEDALAGMEDGDET